ncbi:MAG: SprB repeat-containing protein, partial [Bacteroidetes bacterium]|nr:SprB repeat-containing protein [Bacteroidota bacterium]
MKTQRSDSIWARIVRARVPVIVLLLLLSSLLAEATHFRYGYISWSRDRTYSGPGYKIDFKVTESWRRGFPWNGYYSGNVLNPGVGDSINFGGNFPFRFGDGASANIVLKITEIPAVDVINGVFNVSHIYTTTGSKLAYFEGAARFSTSAGLMNNGDGSFRVETNVTIGNNNDAPVSTLPPIINMIAGISNATYQIPASDPDGDSIYFGLAPSSSFTQGGFSGNTQPPGLSVSSTGLITFNTVGKLAGKLYNAVVRLTDAKGAYVHLDFLIKLTNNSAPPVWDYGTTPANNHVFNLTPGQNVTFTLKASDADSTDYLTIFGNGVPIGASNAPALPVVGAVDSAVQSTFSWTPTNSQLGQFITTFIAQDPQGVQTPTTVKFFVCNVALGDSITNVSCFGGNNGAIDLTPTGGVGTLSYNWGGGITSQDRTNLPAGTYTVTMSDSLSCSVTQTFVVTEPASALTASSSNSTILCNGGTSIVTVSGSGGTSPYTGTGAQSPIPAGNYSYTVTDANGCTATTTGTITEPSLLTASSSNSAILCNGGTSIVTVSGSGGTSPYTGTGAQSPIPAGNYSYTVTDANGCTATTTGTITEPSLLTASSSNSAILC